MGEKKKKQMTEEVYRKLAEARDRRAGRTSLPGIDPYAWASGLDGVLAGDIFPPAGWSDVLREAAWRAHGETMLAPPKWVRLKRLRVSQETQLREMFSWVEVRFRSWTGPVRTLPGSDDGVDGVRVGGAVVGTVIAFPADKMVALLAYLFPDDWVKKIRARCTAFTAGYVEKNVVSRTDR